MSETEATVGSILVNVQNNDFVGIQRRQRDVGRSPRRRRGVVSVNRKGRRRARGRYLRAALCQAA